MEGCELQVLSESEKGFIGRCLFCNHYTIVFKSLNRLFHPEEYDAFKSHMMTLHPLTFVPTRTEEGNMDNFERNEGAKDLQLLQDMLNQASLYEEVIDILDK